MTNGVKLITAPQPVVSDEAKQKRAKADEVFIQAVDALEGALTLKEEIEAMRTGRDVIADTLLAVKEPKPRGRHHHDDTR